ncbi:hypothetical protein [Mesorhizobium ciceri]|uniref:hypothetical protein n=1 Tax=Mesorhizobium TaxID=68287 RepID=UPI0004B4C139|nr:hypothetical protein [Mesorhizobium ciceri]
MTRQTWVRSHARKLPDRPAAFVAVHTELLEARRFDLTMAEVEKEIAAELDREYHVSLR